MKNTYWIMFNANQYELSKLFITHGLATAFAEMDRIIPGEEYVLHDGGINTKVKLMDYEICLLLQTILKQMKISYSLHVWVDKS